jgi:DNA-binding NarL/FixJ family response regulator
MDLSSLEITSRERIVWLRICAGQTTRRIASEMKLSITKVTDVRHSLCNKLGVRYGGRRGHGTDVAAIVRAAEAADILKELPPLVVRRPGAPTW